jgi:hypothetical protein
MTTPTKKMGYEGQLYYGAAGVTAATQVGNCRDLNYAFGPVNEDTTVRGTSGLPVRTSRPVAMELKDLSWNMIHKTDDTTLTALRAAAAAGSAVALRTKAVSGGTGADFDAYIECTDGMPLAGTHTYDFKVVGLEDVDRTPAFNA